jgi:hypothetical protein
VSSRSNASIRSINSINSSPPGSPAPSISSPASYASFNSFPNFKTSPPLSTVPEKSNKNSQFSPWDEPEASTKISSSQTFPSKHSTAQTGNKVQNDTAEFVAAQSIRTQTGTTQPRPSPTRISSTTSIPTTNTTSSNYASSNSTSASNRRQSQVPHKSQTMPISNSTSTTRKQTRDEPVVAQSVAAAAKRKSSASSSIPTFDRAVTHVAAPAPQNTFSLIAPSGRSGVQKVAQTKSSGLGISKNTTSNILTGISLYFPLGEKFNI